MFWAKKTIYMNSFDLSFKWLVKYGHEAPKKSTSTNSGIIVFNLFKNRNSHLICCGCHSLTIGHCPPECGFYRTFCPGLRQTIWLLGFCIGQSPRFNPIYSTDSYPSLSIAREGIKFTMPRCVPRGGHGGMPPPHFFGPFFSLTVLTKKWKPSSCFRLGCDGRSFDWV